MGTNLVPTPTTGAPQISIGQKKGGRGGEHEPPVPPGLFAYVKLQRNKSAQQESTMALKVASRSSFSCVTFSSHSSFSQANFCFLDFIRTPQKRASPLLGSYRISCRTALTGEGKVTRIPSHSQ